MTLWIVAANCGDYYCGCGHGHILGIYTTRDKAKEAAVAAREAENFYRDRDGEPFKPGKCWQDVWLTEGEADGAPSPVLIDGNALEWGHAPEWGETSHG